MRLIIGLGKATNTKEKGEQIYSVRLPFAKRQLPYKYKSSSNINFKDGTKGGVSKAVLPAIILKKNSRITLKSIHIHMKLYSSAALPQIQPSCLPDAKVLVPSLF